LQTIEERAEVESDLHDVAITPLAFPLLVGPPENERYDYVFKRYR
jgi:small neutral amino acid transporter SnatA (MarC family)